MATMTFSHVDSVVASVAGVGTTLSLAAQVPPNPSEPVTYLAYLPTVIGPALVVVANRVLAMYAARKRATAAHLRAEAEEKLTDSDVSNDAEGKRQLLEADIEVAEADALENVRR